MVIEDEGWNFLNAFFGDNNFFAWNYCGLKNVNIAGHARFQLRSPKNRHPMLQLLETDKICHRKTNL